MKKMKKLLVIIMALVIAFQGIPGTNFSWCKPSYAKDYTNGGCVSWVKDRASQIGITLPATGLNKYGLYGASAYWTNLTGYSKGSEPVQYALAVWEFNNGTGNYRNYGHVAFVESVSGNNVTVTEGGCPGYSYGGHTGVIHRTVSKSAMGTLGGCSGFYGYIYLKGSGGSSSSPVTFTEYNLNSVSETNAEVYVKILNPSKLGFSSVGCDVYNASGNLLKSYSEACTLSTSYVNYNCNFNVDMGYTLRAGTTYKFQLYAVVGGTKYKDAMRSFTTKGTSDSVKPVISDVSVYDVSEKGYKVKCKATDNIGIDRVQFPTWTVYNGQDDLASDWEHNTAVRGTLDASGYYVFEVKASDHNNETSGYITHIYAYDKAGNNVNSSTGKIELIQQQESTNKADGNALAEIAQVEYNKYAGQSYNYQYGSSPWCCNFVSWCARQAGITVDVIANTATVQTMYDTIINQCGATIVTTPQRGDLVFYKYTDYDSARFHHIGIMKDGTYSIQGNVNNTWWTGKPDALNNIKEMVFVRPAYNGNYVAPNTAYFSDFNMNKIENTNAEVYIKIQNPNRELVSGVGCELYDVNGQLLKSYSEGCNFTTSYVNYICNFNTDMQIVLAKGTTYKYRLYAIVGGKQIYDSMRQFTTTGTKENVEGGTGQIPTPSVSPVNTPVPTPTISPSSTPKVSPVVTTKPAVKPTKKPVATSKPATTSTEIKVKKKGAYQCLYEGNKLIAKYKITKKGVLVWKNGKKTKKIKAVKSAGFVKDNKKLVCITKKGAAYTITKSGKVKKRFDVEAKKLIKKGKFASKLKIKFKANGKMRTTTFQAEYL